MNAYDQGYVSVLVKMGANEREDGTPSTVPLGKSIGAGAGGLTGLAAGMGADAARTNAAIDRALAHDLASIRFSQGGGISMANTLGGVKPRIGGTILGTALGAGAGLGIGALIDRGRRARALAALDE